MSVLGLWKETVPVSGSFGIQRSVVPARREKLDVVSRVKIASWNPLSSPQFWACSAPGCLDCTTRPAVQPSVDLQTYRYLGWGRWLVCLQATGVSQPGHWRCNRWCRERRAEGKGYIPVYEMRLPQSHLLFPVCQEAGDPWTDRGEHSELREFGGDGFWCSTPGWKQNPCICARAVNVLQDVE